MPILSQQNEAQRVLARLQSLYPTPHSDTADELLENERLLDEALAQGATEDLLASKIVILNRAHGTVRRKLYTLIAGRFWLQNAGAGHTIVGKGYQPPGPRHIENFSLKP